MGSKHVLVANRGEIAVRVMRTASRLGYRTTAIHSEPDRDSPHVAMADHAVALRGDSARETYLDIAQVIAAAKATGADAIHPGYGFLSERTDFAAACDEAGLTFIGPPASAIATMGDKRAARRALQGADVPLVPGYDGPDQQDAALEKHGNAIGFPLMVKAAAGGGGRGMRRVDEAGGLAGAMRIARAEAEASFGDGTLMLERCVVGGRHVEVQVIADAHGNVAHLGERDCSTQRRFQKIIEESPSPAVDADLRGRMGAAAVAVARSCDYRGVGTVEFLLDDEGAFYFLEMNTRLQVEHPVTEAVYGVDLVELQLRIAEGRPLSPDDWPAQPRGHAIEARLVAEDCAAGFLPQTGTVGVLSLPPGVRVDHALREGLAIGAHYDSMIAKVIVHGSDRDEARRKLSYALSQLVVLGLRTNRDFLRRVCDDDVFAAGEVRTDFLETRGAALADDPALSPYDRALSAVAWATRERAGEWGWTNGVGHAWPVVLGFGEERQSVTVRAGDGPASFVVTSEDGSELALTARSGDGKLRVGHDGTERTHALAFVDGALWIDGVDGVRCVEDLTYAPPQAADSGAEAGVQRSPMEGQVVEVAAAAGDTVSAGDTVVVIEAMKLQHRVVAPIDGVVASIEVEQGQQVALRQPLFEISAPGDSGDQD